MARIAAVPELAPEGGQVVVTRFECGNLPSLIAVRMLHARLKRHVKRRARGFIGVKTVILWQPRTMLSISLWQDLASIYSMGNVTQHVEATRVPAHLGVETSCGIFYLVGDWRRVMFGGSAPTRSPLHPLEATHLANLQQKGSPENGEVQ